jgi:hypothetical protein
LIVWLGVTRALERFEQLAHQGVNRDLRVAMDQDTWRIFRDYPWSGTGPGDQMPVQPALTWLRLLSMAWSCSTDKFINGDSVEELLGHFSQTRFWLPNRIRNTLSYGFGAEGGDVNAWMRRNCCMSCAAWSDLPSLR